MDFYIFEDSSDLENLLLLNIECTLILQFCFLGHLLKGNSNSQGILNWIIQILHYYYRKQLKNIENSQILEQNLLISLPFSLFTMACASFSFLAGEFFQFFKCHKWSFIKYIVSFFWFENVNGFLQVRHATRGRGGGLPCPFLKIKKSALILEKNALIVSILVLNLPFKM